MLVKHVPRTEGKSRCSDEVAGAVSAENLRAIVERLSFPRHYEHNRAANEQARDWLASMLDSLGLDVSFQGQYDNVIANQYCDDSDSPLILLGAHYDTVPTTPGADDNNSAIAVCLESARVLSEYTDVRFRVVIFNREEDGLLGSIDYVSSLTEQEKRQIAESHIFEMVGYFTSEPGSQGKPEGLPIKLPDKGDFLGLLSNSNSNKIAKQVRQAAEQVGGKTPLVT